MRSIELVRQDDGSYAGEYHGRRFVVAREPDRRGRLRWYGKLGLLVTLACKSRHEAVKCIQRMVDG